MASLNNINAIKSMYSLCRAFNAFNISSNLITRQNVVNNRIILCRSMHKTAPVCDLMEFFDNKNNWGENEVKVGRSWRLDELRIKSNVELHKLWYILLKERNMLLTMEQECSDAAQLFPNPERIDKVKESMTNLETVVRERNKAYHLLETGRAGERPGEVVTNQLGLRFYYRHTEHLIPKVVNNAWKKTHNFEPRGFAVKKFLLLYREKLYNEKRKKRTRDRNHVIGLFKRFPNMDTDALKSDYPDVDVEKCRKHPKAQGHFVPK